jgi:hypothetical protein
MRLLLFILSVVVLSSCGPAYHLRKAKKHLLLAEAKGATLKADTVFREIEVERVRVDTVVHNVTLEKLMHDTITVVQDNQVVKIKYLSKEKKVYVNVKSTKPHIVRVPVIVTKKVIAGYSRWNLITVGWAALLVGFLIGVIYKSRRGKSE